MRFADPVAIDFRNGTPDDLLSEDALRAFCARTLPHHVAGPAAQALLDLLAERGVTLKALRARVFKLPPEEAK